MIIFHYEIQNVGCSMGTHFAPTFNHFTNCSIAKFKLLCRNGEAIKPLTVHSVLWILNRSFDYGIARNTQRLIPWHLPFDSTIPFCLLLWAHRDCLNDRLSFASLKYGNLDRDFVACAIFVFDAKTIERTNYMATLQSFVRFCVANMQFL